MPKTLYPMSASIEREVYFKMPFEKYFETNGNALRGSAEAIKNADEETRRNYNKLLRVGKLHDSEILRGGFGAIANYGLTLYLEQHPEKTLNEALDPEIDVEEKRACGTHALNIMSGLPENATPEEADRYIENNEYVKDEEYVANVSGLVQKGVKMFINIDYSKELLYAYEAQGKDIHEVLNDPANLQTTAFFIRDLNTFQHAFYQTLRESGKEKLTACYDDLNLSEKLDTKFKDVNTINIYKDAYAKLDAEGLRSDFIKAQAYNYMFLRESTRYTSFCMGNRVAYDPELEENVGGHAKVNNFYIEGKITGLKRLGTLKPEEFPPERVADAKKGNYELNRSAAVFWEALRNIADYHKFTEIPDDVWGCTVGENNKVTYSGSANDVLTMPDEAFSDITRQELADTLFYHAAMARHTLYKDSEELLRNAYTPEQRAEIAELVKNDKNLEAFANSKELAAFTLAHAMAGGNANNIFTENSLMEFDGKAAVDFLKANAMFTAKDDGALRDEAAVRNIKQLADSAYNSLSNYTFPAAGSAYYGFAELARFAENCSAAFKNVDSRLAKADDPVLQTTRQYAEVMKNLTAGLDPYKMVAAKLAMDKINKEMQGKSMAYIAENCPQNFFKQLADGIEANLKENVKANLKKGETLTLDDAKNFVADGKYTDKLTRETCAAHEDYVVVDEKYKKDLAKLNLKKLTGDTLAAGIGFFDSVMRQYPNLDGCMKEKVVSKSYKSCAELFVIDGKPATDYLKKNMGKQYNKYSDAEKEWLLKAAIAGAVTDGKHVVEARQYTIDRTPAPKIGKEEQRDYLRSTVRYTRITCNMNAGKAIKTAKKFDKKIEKAHEELLDPVKYRCIKHDYDVIAKREIGRAIMEADERYRLANMPHLHRRKDAALSDQLRQATSNNSEKKTGDVEKTDENVKQRTPKTKSNK